jgi:hypothetical protein
MLGWHVRACARARLLRLRFEELALHASSLAAATGDLHCAVCPSRRNWSGGRSNCCSG